jgi:hypothetical protein
MSEEVRITAEGLKLSPAARFENHITLDRHEAKVLFNGLPHTMTLKEFHRFLLAQGHVLSYKTIWNWARVDQWDKVQITEEKVIKTAFRLSAILARQASMLTAELVKGVSIEFLLRVRNAVQETVEIKTPKDVNDMLGAYDKLAELEHKLRNEELTWNKKLKARAKPGGDSLVNLTNFRKVGSEPS